MPGQEGLGSNIAKKEVGGMDNIQKFVDENAMVIFCVTAIVIVALTCRINPEAKDIANVAIGGLIGYLTKKPA